MTTVSKAERAKASKPASIHAHRFALAVSDLVLGLAEWRTWWVLAFNDIRQRYRRSTLGQFWLTISMAAMIAGIGVIYAFIFDRPISSYVPFLGIGLITWNLLSCLINDLATCFINSDTYLQSYPTPRSAVIYRTIVRNLIASAHNFLIVPFLLVLFGIPVTAIFLLVVPALILIVLNSVWIGMLIGPLCSRFRDLPQIILNVVQLAFFVTPILYHPSQLQDRLWAITHLNPFASFVEIVRAPMLNEVPEGHHYLLAVLCTIIGWAIALPFYARFRGRIVYWL
jgi:ABC-type polysaccharide/polyol phosphate export permease